MHDAVWYGCQAEEATLDNVVRHSVQEPEYIDNLQYIQYKNQCT